MHFLTLVVSAGFGLAAILMFANGQLGYILARSFHIPVFLGGICLLTLVLLRAITIRWSETDHHHDSAWQSSRLILLSFPIGIFLIGLPNSGFSQERIRRMLGGDDALTINTVESRREGTVSSFRELKAAAGDPELRERLTGQTAVLEGRISRTDSVRLSLFRLRMVCCAADAAPLKVRIVLRSGNLNGFHDFDWVRMKGRVQFVESPVGELLTPVVVVDGTEDIQKIPPGDEYDE
jgi:hypothetical protein